MNKNLELFIKTVKDNSSLKGIRWDDLVFKFEYAMIELPAMISFLESSSVSDQVKTYLKEKVQTSNEIDLSGLKTIVSDPTISANYADLATKAVNDCHERIKHAQLERLQALTDL